MKLQTLAVIFIIIILPISIILTSYVQSNVQTLNLQTSYDSKLNNATYDALKAYQMNAASSDTSNLANTKLRYISASATSFFDSVATNFNMAGYNKDILKEYVPALVYTMYDGYYIYSPFKNTLPAGQISTTYPNDEYIWELKPYIHYSCRYKDGSDDFVISYSLDNYITIDGLIKGNPVHQSGYLLSNSSADGRTYRGFSISEEELHEENIFINDDDDKPTLCKCIKIDGVKYYQEPSPSSKWFQFLNGEKNYIWKDITNTRTNTIEKVISTDEYTKNKSAVLYYKEAYEFTNYVLNDLGLRDLSTTKAIDENGNSISNKFVNAKIFATNSNQSIEDADSNFNQHRLEIIRYSIEKNLSIAIANYNNYSTNVQTDFRMPNLKEDEWDKIIHNVSIISFLQGLSIGGKVYNGYSIITNSKNDEAVSDASIYIINNGEYYRPTDTSLITKSGFFGVYNVDFERKTYEQEDGTLKYFFPNSALMSYSNIFNNSQESTDDIVKYMVEKVSQRNPELVRAYITALGRERYSMYKTNNDVEQLKNKLKN